MGGKDNREDKVDCDGRTTEEEGDGEGRGRRSDKKM